MYCFQQSSLSTVSLLLACLVGWPQNAAGCKELQKMLAAPARMIMFSIL